MDGANNLFVKRFCFTPVGAGKALVVTYMVAVICSPPLGLIIDKVCHKRYFIMLCMVIFTDANDIKPFIIILPSHKWGLNRAWI